MTMSVFSAEAWVKVWTYRGTFLLGLRNTAATAVFAILLALTLGIVFGLCATGKSRLLRGVARAYVEVIQNTPVLLQICFLYTRWPSPGTASASSRRALWPWACTTARTWRRCSARASSPSPKGSSRPLSPRAFPMWGR